MSAERVLVTGATGFLGSHIAETYLRAGHRVRCALRETSDTRWIDGLEVERTTLDLRDREAMRRALADVKIVVHSAGLTRARSRREYFAVNAEGTARLAEEAAAAGGARFVFISSIAARGPDGSAGPASDYGASKREAEARLEALGNALEIVTLRPAGVYGPRDFDFLPLFRLASRGWLLAPGAETRLQPVFAADVAEAALLAGVREMPGVGPYPVAESRTYGWDDLVVALSDAVGRRVRLIRAPGGLLVAGGGIAELVARVSGRAPTFDRRRADDLARHTWTCDTEATAQALGWSAKADLRAGLGLTADWYRSGGWLPGRP